MLEPCDSDCTRYIGFNYALTAAMQKVIQLHYMMDGRSPTYYEIGQKMGYCEVYIKTMEREACRRLAASLSSMQSPAVVEYIQQLEDRRA